ncbi:hypothetical protein PtA15_12A352 [Puccinia triticina]|uniref:Uncharacterized protein n=1 Tax=Puccinia triticina TaxID=208348 RepID=A0ABY7CZM9_9BASI|nr:uncharacterized protein PtA15_12A352 [Puccinia triticina]WAQ90363.1 hypothetical protein PtA15_12A352 [Puccinia triticina]
MASSFVKPAFSMGGFETTISPLDVIPDPSLPAETSLHQNVLDTAIKPSAYQFSGEKSYAYTFAYCGNIPDSSSSPMPLCGGRPEGA